MADPKQLALLEQGIEGWNKWRQEQRQEEDKYMATTRGLNRANLRGADLSGAILSGADLRKADLRVAILSGADLSGADLSGADLTGADLSGADLSGAIISRTLFCEADLTGADLTGANLIEAYFIRAKLIETDLAGVDLAGVDLAGVDLRKANLSGADLSEADLSEANLSEANLSGANLENSQTRYTNFEGATLTGVCIQDWVINDKTNFNKVICDYIYLKSECVVDVENGAENGYIFSERRPHSLSQDFKAEEVTNFFQSLFLMIDKIFKNWGNSEHVYFDLMHIYELNQSKLIAQYQARFEDKDKQYQARLEDKDKQLEDKDKEYQLKLEDKDKKINQLWTKLEEYMKMQGKIKNKMTELQTLADATAMAIEQELLDPN